MKTTNTLVLSMELGFPLGSWSCGPYTCRRAACELDEGNQEELSLVQILPSCTSP